MDSYGKVNVGERKAIAERYFLQGYNCCQSVLLTFSDIIGQDEAVLKAIGSTFGGGMARMREVCGAVSALMVLAGFILPADDPSDRARRSENYALGRKLAGEFKARKGSIVCRELLGLKKAEESPAPSQRTPEYYKTRPCTAFVGLSASIFAEYLNSI